MIGRGSVLVFSVAGTRDAVADMTKLCLHADVVRMRVFADLPGIFCILLKRQDRAIVHHGGKTHLNGLPDIGKLRRMIQMDADRNGVGACRFFQHGGDKVDAPVLHIRLEAHEKCRRPLFFADIHHGLYHIIVADVKPWNRVMLFPSIRQHFFHGYKHRTSSFSQRISIPPVTSSVAPVI